MVGKMNTDLLDFLSDDDIKILIQSFDLKWMLEPFKKILRIIQNTYHSWDVLKQNL